MKLFKDKFVPRGMSAEFVGELQTDTEATQRIVQGRHQLVFCGPENLFEIPVLSNVSKCLGPLKDIKNTWMMQTGKENESGVHSKSKQSEDISSIVNVHVQ